MLRNLVFIAAVIFLFCICTVAQTTSTNSETVMVLPFENVSNKPDFNWIGESLADSLSDLLKIPSINVITNEERKIIQQRLKVPLTTLPSLATSLKLAREGKASLLVAGKYNIVPAQGEIAASVSVTARVIRVNEGRFLSEEMADGRRITRDINFLDALGNLQTIEGQLAYQILYQRDRNLAFPQKYFVDSSNKVPSKAFEAYIKGLLTSDSDLKTRENFLKNSMRLFAEAKAAENAEPAKQIYADAALELGHLYLNQKQTQSAVEYFSKIPTNDAHFAESSFYIGLIYWQQGNYEQALAVLNPLADELKLNSVYNTLGAIAVEASRKEKDRVKSAAKLNQGVDFLHKAADSDPDDPESLFNYSLSLFLNNDFKGTAKLIRPVLALNPRDGEAYYLLAKSLERIGDPSAADFDNQARRFLPAYAKLETDWQRAKSIDGISLRIIQPPRRDFVSVVMTNKANSGTTPQPVNETDVLLEQAQNFYKSGRDDDALQITRRVISSDPMSADAYLIQGKVYLRRGNMDDAVGSLKTALFWNNRMIEAHIALAKIFIEKKDCQQAQNYVVAAAAIDENNQDVAALQRQIERCAK